MRSGLGYACINETSTVPRTHWKGLLVVVQHVAFEVVKINKLMGRSAHWDDHAVHSRNQGKRERLVFCVSIDKNDVTS
jgi:hypothetical protein